MEDKKYEIVYKNTNITDCPETTYFISIEEHKAITQKLTELGWIH
jgi:hypothetical protein